MTTELDPVENAQPISEETEPKAEENKFTPEMPVKKDTERSEPPKPAEPELRITNPEGDKDEDPKRNQVNKKLSAMSKNTKEKQKNRRLSKPTSISQGSLSKMLNISPMYLLGIIGVIIAGISLWYQRKSYLQDTGGNDDDPPDLEKDPAESTSKNFVHTPSDLRGAVPEPPESPTKKKDPHLDPWAWQRHHQQTGVLPNYPGSFDFD